MAGQKCSKQKLNKTLVFISKLLNNNNINDWFIGYGTLLGIVRDKSCIHKDDDIDIVISNKHYDDLKLLLEKAKLPLCRRSVKLRRTKHIIKTNPTEHYASIDFYMASTDDNGNYNDVWEKVIWSNCLLNGSLIKEEWNGTTLNLPNNYITKLVKRYGESWRIPQNSKGPMPREPVL